MTTIRIRNTELDSNAWVDLKAATFTPGYKRFNEAVALVARQVSTLPEGDRIGIDTPIITIKGYINTDDFASTAELWSETPSTITSVAEDDTSNAGIITLGYLLALWRNNTGQTQIELYLGCDDSKQWKNWDNSSTTITVVVDDINPVPDQTSDGLHFINYTIVCREVVPDSTYVS